MIQAPGLQASYSASYRANQRVSDHLSDYICWIIHLDDVELSNFVFFCPVVVNLLQVDEAQYPFSQKPPIFIKAKLYNYHFTDPVKDKWAPYLSI